jgi:hypothetical protein
MVFTACLRSEKRAENFLRSDFQVMTVASKPLLEALPLSILTDIVLRLLESGQPVFELLTQCGRTLSMATQAALYASREGLCRLD